MAIRDCALISTTLELPEVDGPVWYAMPVLQTLAAELRHAGWRVDQVEQDEDADGGMFCTIDNDVFFIHLIFADENLWMVRVEQHRGCLSVRKSDPSKLTPMLNVLHGVLLNTPSISLLGWINDLPNKGPAELPRFETPF